MKNYLLFPPLLILILSLNIVYAQEEQFGISLNCLEECEDQKVDYSKDIILVLTIKNKLDYWVSIGKEEQWGGADFTISVENSNLKDGKDYDVYQDFLGKEFFIKPKAELKIYLPFRIYNDLDKENRLEEWKISPEMSISNVKFYTTNPFESKETPIYINQRSFSIQSPIKGNLLKFESVKPEVKVPKGSLTIPESFWEKPFNKYFWFPLFVLIIGGIILSIIIKKKKR